MTTKVSIRGYIVPDNDKWIYDWMGLEATCPADVSKALADAGGEAVTVEINSGGGEISAGSEMYTALRGYEGEAEIPVMGYAHSAASVVAMARRCLMSPTSMMMVHNVSSGADGDYHEMDKTSEQLQTANRALASAYMAKSGMTQDEALAMMDRTTWMTAEDAVKNGLVDGVLFENQQPTALYNGTPGLPTEAVNKIRGLVKRPQDHNTNQTNILSAKLKLLNLGGTEV